MVKGEKITSVGGSRKNMGSKEEKERKNRAVDEEGREKTE